MEPFTSFLTWPGSDGADARRQLHNASPQRKGVGAVDTRQIGQNTFRYRLLLLAILPLVMFVPACGGDSDGSCPEGLNRHQGKCLTSMAIVYVDCTEGRGISTTTKVSGGVAGTLQVVTNASVNVASEKTRQEDRTVALQKIKDCLDIAKRSSAANNPEQRVVTRLIRVYEGERTLPPASVSVPDVGEKTPDEAQQTLENLHFKVERVEQASADVEEGKVIGTDPAAGEKAEQESTVKLLISTGPEQAEVPSVIGLQRADAENQLNTAGFTVDISKFDTADAQPGTVLEQDPVAGTTAEPGSIVTITVAEAPVG